MNDPESGSSQSPAPHREPILFAAENPSTNSAAEGVERNWMPWIVALVVICCGLGACLLAGPARRQFQRKRRRSLRKIRGPGQRAGQSGQQLCRRSAHLRRWHHRESRQPHHNLDDHAGSVPQRNRRRTPNPAGTPQPRPLPRPLCGHPADQRRSPAPRQNAGLSPRLRRRHSHVESIASRASNHGHRNPPLSHIDDVRKPPEIVTLRGTFCVVTSRFYAILAAPKFMGFLSRFRPARTSL